MKNHQSWQSRIGSWLILALAVAIVGNIVWVLIQPLIIPAVVVLVVGFILVLLIHRWRRRNFW